MSRIEFEELSILDVEWYGIDEKGNVAVFCNAGAANVPEFVCADKERYEQLVAFFETLPSISEAQFCFECPIQNYMPFRVAKKFSEKGLFYYDSDDHSKSKDNICVLQSYYTISSKPLNALKYADLPMQIQELLKDNHLPIDDFTISNMIEVKNAY